MLKRTVARGFQQHRTPIMPQMPVNHPTPHNVAYLLCRQPVVKPTPHPLETEFGFTLEREHNRYARHDVETSQFFSAKGQPIDVSNRSEPAQIINNFFNLEGYQDALKVVTDRYQPVPRVTDHDFFDPFDESLKSGPPKRKTIQRRLDDFLFFIVRSEASGKWSLPTTQRRPHETLRMAVDRAISEQHNDALDAYVWSNAPQAIVRGAGVSEGEATEADTFVFVATYLAGRPNFGGIQPKCADHAWVTRSELCQYHGEFETESWCQVLRDIVPDATFNATP